MSVADIGEQNLSVTYLQNAIRKKNNYLECELHNTVRADFELLTRPFC